MLTIEDLRAFLLGLHKMRDQPAPMVKVILVNGPPLSGPCTIKDNRFYVGSHLIAPGAIAAVGVF